MTIIHLQMNRRMFSAFMWKCHQESHLCGKIPDKNKEEDKEDNVLSGSGQWFNVFILHEVYINVSFL